MSVSECEVTSPVPERGAGHQGQGQYRSVWWPPPPPGLSDNSDCVLAKSAEVGTVPLAEEAVFVITI